MANVELARAYVTIVPSMEGARGAISDALTEETEAAGASAGSAGGRALTGALGLAARGTALAVSAVATGIGTLTTQAVSAYSDYEQLTGGIETLYGDASSQMMQYAQEAAAATGQDMNSYMESAIATSAAMISAVEGDQARAADLTNMSMIDMADNANKLGTDMESIQNAYRGFARANFTMLDNLALPYAGTQAEMERLLADAQAISGVEYDISSYADIVEAIHVIQEEMGITGTTASEASETISGSLGALSASWQNLLVGVADPTADLGSLIDNLVGNAETALGNLIPVISNALSGMGQAITTLAPIIAEELPGLISSILPPLLSSAGVILEALAQGILEALPVLAPVAADLIIQLVDFVIQNLPLVIDSAIQIILAVTDGLTEAMPELIPAAVEAVITIVESLIENLDLLVNAALMLIIALADGLLQALPELLAAVPDLVLSLAAELASMVQPLVDVALGWGTEFLTAITTWFDNIWTKIQEFFSPLVEFVSPILEALRNLFDTIFEAIRVIISRVLTAIKTKIETIWNGIKTWISDHILEPLKETFSNAFNAIYERVEEPLNNVKNKVEEIFGWISNFIGGIIEGAANWGADLIGNFLGGLESARDNLASGINGIADTIHSVIGFSEPEKGPLSDFHTYAPDMIDLFCQGLEDSQPELETALNNTLSLPSISSPDTLQLESADFSSVDYGGDLIIPVYLGQERFDTAIIRSEQIATYRRGS